MERVRSSTLQVNQLLARRARLEAERDGVSSLPVPIELSQLAGEKAARTFVAGEDAILRAEQARRRAQKRENALKAVAARSEVEALRHKLDQIDAQKDMRTERLNDMQKLKDRGVVTSNTVLTARTELSEIEAHRQDYLVALTQAETRLAEVEEASERLSLENSAKLATALATIDQQIASAQETMISAKSLAALLYRPVSGTQTYEIVRQVSDGVRTLRAAETSPLMPGDVLKINSSSAAVSPATVDPAPQPEPPRSYIRTATENKR
jgi:hypothetical protein